MAMHEEKITRSHEHYLRHLLLIGQAAPKALNALIKKEEALQNDAFSDRLRKFYNEKLPVQLQNTKTETWSTRTLCDVISVLYGSDLEPEKMRCIHVIREQRNDMEKYAESAALPFEVFEKKWRPLADSLLELIKDIEDYDKFECKRMIISFESEPILVNLKLLDKLKETKDVDVHVQLAIREKVVTKIHGKVEDLEVKSESESNEEDKENLDEQSLTDVEPVFTEKLRDTYVYVDEPAILTCKVNTATATVLWRKDFNVVESSETLNFVNDHGTHWLAISSARLTDTGKYSCLCGNISTSALLKVSEKPVSVVKELHVDADEADIRENMDIYLICEVNLHTRKPTWWHNNKEITACKRIFITSLDLEHKLTILNARPEDEGEYTVDFGQVTSSTYLTVKGNIDLLHRRQLTEELYRNWIRGALALKYLKIGLEQVADQLLRKQHSEFLTFLLQTGTICTDCTIESLLPSHNKTKCKKKSKCVCLRPQNRMRCPNGFCSQFYDLVIDSHQYYDPVFSNTEISNWAVEPWSFGTAYINTTGYKGKNSATEVDCAGLLSLFINNTFFHTSLGDVDINGETDVFKQAKDARNDILHNARYELSKGQLDDIINLFKSVLEIRDGTGNYPLLSEPGVKPAIHSLTELQSQQIEIHVSEDLQQHIRSLREHSMNELAEKFAVAEKEKDIKIQQLEEKLKQTEKELQLMNELRKSLQKKKFSQKQKKPFELLIHLQALRVARDASVEANQLIYRFVRVDVGRRYKWPDIPSTSTDMAYINTTLAINRLLDHFFDVPDAQIGDVLNNAVSVDLKIKCYSFEAIDKILALINGATLQKETLELRKCLELEGEEKTPCDIVTSCSLQSINETRKQLYDRGLVKQVSNTCDKHRNMPIIWFCSEHDNLCCARCRETDHRDCVGIKQGLSTKKYKKEDVKPMSVKDKKPYNIKLYNQKAVTDGYRCSVLKTIKLPKGKYLLADRDNSRLKKLDSFYKLVGHCDLPDKPYDVCYIGNKTAAVSLGDLGIQLVGVSGKMKLKALVKLDHFCMGLDFHGDNLYVTCRDMVYTYNSDVAQQRVLYKKPEVNDGESLGHVVVSDSGDRIYMTDVDGGLVVIDSDGNHLSTLKNDVLQGASGICLVSDGSVLVTDENAHAVHQVDSRGERVLGTIITSSECPDKPWSVYFDEEKSSLIVGYFYQNHITVFETV